MRKPVWMAMILAAGLAAASVAHGDVIIKLKNGVEIKVPVNNDDIASINLGEGGKSASPPPPAAPAAPATPARPAEYKQAPPSPEDLAKAKGPELPGASSFKTGAFGKDTAEGGGSGRIIHVGPGKDYERLGDVAGSLQNGDVVEIEGGLYLNDFAEIAASDVTLRGVHGRPHFRATVGPPNNKGIWVLSGDNVSVDNIEFSGAVVPDLNGAGIRYEGGKLDVRNSSFHHNQSGILTINRPDMVVEIRNSEFAYRVHAGSGQAHGIYIGTARRVVVMNSYFHHNDVGHHIKVRGAENWILYNKVTDQNGGASYLIEAPNCGATFVIGNVLHKGANAENSNAVSYGAEGCEGKPLGLYVTSNTMVNDRHAGTFVLNRSGATAFVANNLLVGRIGVSDGPAKDVNNRIESSEKFVDRAGYDYHLAKDADAIDQGVKVGNAGKTSLMPANEYGFPKPMTPRKALGKLDVGAFEYGGAAR
ncbi:right-handed parallel beta-helix repeat-containing protein [Emcibacter sp. SYSU 3D8]|uniref:right-handed parallel beta-helix repeat-containing protein n=1 Tax=Emcibacter sp. SYSU 3D8 TaxID=3133969 RepID=UPI0031FF1582